MLRRAYSFQYNLSSYTKTDLKRSIFLYKCFISTQLNQMYDSDCKWKINIPPKVLSKVSALKTALGVQSFRNFMTTVDFLACNVT